MELKKSKAADLDKQRPLLLSIGIIISLGLVTTAMEWKSQIEPIISLQELKGCLFYDEPLPGQKYDYNVPITIWSEDNSVVGLPEVTDSAHLEFYICGICE